MKFLFLALSFAIFAIVLTTDAHFAEKISFSLLCLATALMSLNYDRIEAKE